jgi:ketosteroid isomerase-like protein
MRSLLLFISFITFVPFGMAQTAPHPELRHANDDTTAVSPAVLIERFNTLAQLWRKAYNAGDSTTLSVMYTPDAQYISGHVQGLVANGRDRVIANFQNGVRLGGHIDSVSVLSVHASCDLATLLCRYEATNSGQKAVGRNLLVVKKIGNTWLIVLHMTVV